VRVPLRRRERLVPEQRLNVVQRHPVLHHPARGSVPHDPRRQAADPGRADRRVPYPVAEVTIADRAAFRRGEHQLVLSQAGNLRMYISSPPGPPDFNGVRVEPSRHGYETSWTYPGQG
jgi:hypothetical protein